MEDAGNLLEWMHAVDGIITADSQFINHSWILGKTCNSQVPVLIKAAVIGGNTLIPT